MKNRLFSLFSILIILSLVFAIPVSPKNKKDVGLTPGEFVTFEQAIL